MHYKIQLRPLAAIEIIEAYDWYESQKNGLGHEFLEELDIFYKILQHSPESYSYYEKPVRQGRIKRFPYIVIYELIDNFIIVYSVFMTKQNPDKIRTM